MAGMLYPVAISKRVKARRRLGAHGKAAVGLGAVGAGLLGAGAYGAGKKEYEIRGVRRKARNEE